MDTRSLNYIARACEGKLLAGAPDLEVRRISTDSRTIQPGDVFFALRGDRFDGHNYLTEAARTSGAMVVQQDQVPAPANLPSSVGLLAVENTRTALGSLARRYRSELRLAVVAVAGSNGKTTTKELLASVLQRRFSTLWSEASFNNDIGVPLSLLRIERQHQAAVLEVGTNHPGELSPLVHMVQPQFGVVTNIGREHLEFFGDLTGVAQEEGCLAELLPSFGMLFLNGDDAWTPALKQRTAANVVTVGFAPDNDWRARNVRVGEEGVVFTVDTERAEYSGEYRIQLLGRHQVSNALLALAVGRELGVPPEEARRGLADCVPPKLRLQIKQLHGVRVINDAYNANADSMRAALQTLRDLPCVGQRWAVLGDMAELGDETGPAHREIGAFAAALGLDGLVTVGRWAEETAAAARQAGFKQVTACAETPSAASVVIERVKSGDVILIKASRATGLDKIEEELTAVHQMKSN